MRRDRRELAVYAALTVAALVVRLIALGDRPFHHDESQDAYFSWIFSTQGDYTYQPILHGPLRFYLTAAAYEVLGDTDFTARLAPALMGAAMVPLLHGLREQLGRNAALTAAVLLAFGPSYLYFSRFAREDIYVACLTLALIVVVFRYLDRPRPGQPAILGALLAASFATKETTYITVFVGGSFFLVALAVQARRAGFAHAPIVVALKAVGWRPWLGCLVAFAAVFAVLFSTFLTHPAGVWDGLYESLAYWLGQHDVGRGGEPWFHYLVILGAEEWPTLALGLFGAVWALRNPTLLRLFLIWGFVVSLIVYSWAGEKFSWLVLHPLLPLVLLAGIGLQALWRARDGWPARAGLALVVVGAVYVGVSSFWINAAHRADPRELLVTAQSSEDVLGVRDELVRRHAVAQAAGRPFRILIDTAEGATFPWAWYLRDLGPLYVDLSQSSLPLDYEAVIMTDAGRARLEEELPPFDVREFRFRVWWVRDYGSDSPGAWWRWMTQREPWNATGGMPGFLAIRRGA